MRFLEIISESKQIALAKKAYASLSYEARDAINSWESSNWIGGPLEKHIVTNDSIAQEIAQAFQPVRDSIPGNSVKLYRGIRSREEEHNRHLKHRVLESWTSDRRVAEYFADLRTDQDGNGDSKFYNIPSINDIRKAINQYKTKGYVKFANRYYMRNKEHPQYYNIYDRYKNFITDGDNIERELMDLYNDAKDYNKEINEKGQVIERNINKNQIIWITNNLNSKEYIIRVR